MTLATDIKHFFEKTFSYARRVDSDRWMLLALPWLAFGVNPTFLLYDVSTSFTDAWIYTGYFLHLPSYLQKFSAAPELYYYGDRLPWLLPGFLIFKLFPPLIAHAVLHLALFYLATFTLYTILNWTLNHRVALLGAVLLGCYWHFWLAISSNYVDGIGIVYFLLLLLSLTWACRSSRWQMALVASGAAFAAMVFTNPFWVAIAPAPLVYYSYLNWRFSNQFQHQFQSQKLHPNPVWPSLFWLVIGGLGVMLGLGLVNLTLGGPFIFFMPTLRFILSQAGVENVWVQYLPPWQVIANHLALPMLGAVGSLSCVLLAIAGRPLNKIALLFQLVYLAHFGIAVAIQAYGQPLLQHGYYISYLMPTLFLAIAAQFEPLASQMPRRWFYLWVGSWVGLAIGPLIPAESNAVFTKPLFYETQVYWHLARKIQVLLGFGILWVGFNLIRTIPFKTLISLLLALSFLAFNNPNVYIGPSWPRQVSMFRAIAASLDQLKATEPALDKLVWYSAQDPWEPVFGAVCSTFVIYRFRCSSLPEPNLYLDSEDFRPGQRVAIFSSPPTVWQEMDREPPTEDAIASAQANLAAQSDLELKVLRTVPVNQGSVLFEITIAELQPKTTSPAPSL